MDSVKLLNRTDTKFIFNRTDLENVLGQVTNDYHILSINKKRTASYRTLYFDTDNFKFYNHHHNRKENRYKVRIRKYLDSDLCFLEIKNKRKGRTVKTRTKIKNFEESLSSESLQFISNILPYNVNLNKKIWNTFDRITLVNNTRKERLTIDFNLTFNFEGLNIKLDKLVICELKQEKAVRNSPIHRALKINMIRPTRVSKYCIGVGLIYKELKRNRFKQKHLKIEKINHGIFWN